MCEKLQLTIFINKIYHLDVCCIYLIPFHLAWFHFPVHVRICVPLCFSKSCSPCVFLFSRSIEGIEITNIQRRMFEPLKYLTHMWVRSRPYSLICLIISPIKRMTMKFIRQGENNSIGGVFPFGNNFKWIHKFSQFSKEHVFEQWLYFGIQTLLRPVQGVPRLLAEDGWDKLQHARDPHIDKQFR